MKLFINTDEDENQFPDLHPDYILLSDNNKKIIQEIISDKNCEVFDSNGKGAFGSIKISKNFVTKKVDLLPINIIKIGSRYANPIKINFLVNRLKNYCSDVKKYVKSVKKYFPNNILEVTDCSYCNNNRKILLIFKMERNSTHEKDMKYMLKNKKLSKEEIKSLITQIKEISMKLNEKKIFHNDLKPANILIAKSDKDFVYPSGLKIKKGDRIPILIDYDLHSLDKLRLPEVGDVELPKNDFEFFMLAYNKLKNGGKNRRKNKKIRKHKGIDQNTGKLKKGYKYTDKLLKGGFYQIIKK